MAYCIDLDVARSECEQFGIPASRENLRRVARAHDLVQRSLIRKELELDDMRIYRVGSQNEANKDYIVVAINGSLPKCTCPDSQKGNPCKHGIAVLLQEEIDRDLAWISEMEAMERFREDGYAGGYHPDVW